MRSSGTAAPPPRSHRWRGGPMRATASPRTGRWPRPVRSTHGPRSGGPPPRRTCTKAGSRRGGSRARRGHGERRRVGDLRQDPRTLRVEDPARGRARRALCGRVVPPRRRRGLIGGAAGPCAPRRHRVLGGGRGRCARRMARDRVDHHHGAPARKRAAGAGVLARGGGTVNGGALAIFVKTPGHSGLKTRLAAERGERYAVEWYRRAAAAVSSVARRAHARHGVTAYWAVAEAGALDAWP